jgi:hypothetical protein
LIFFFLFFSFFFRLNDFKILKGFGLSLSKKEILHEYKTKVLKDSIACPKIINVLGTM